MNARPDVSIIIPTHDRPVLLQRSLASALAQTGAIIEVVVVDDGSDPPARIPDSAAVTLVRTENGGASAARNAGLARARGTHVLFLDSDDWLEPGAVARLLATTRDSGAAVAFGSWRNVDSVTGAASVATPPAPYADALANAVAGGWVAGSFLMPRAVAARFDPAISLWEVVVFACESLTGGAAAAACDATVVNIAQHADPGRISNRHDHFEPMMTGRTFAGLKAGLARRDLLNAARIAALDERLLACLHALLREDRADEAREIYDAITWSLVPRQTRYRPASLAWCARWGGLAGARSFTTLNRMLGR